MQILSVVMNTFDYYMQYDTPVCHFSFIWLSMILDAIIKPVFSPYNTKYSYIATLIWKLSQVNYYHSNCFVHFHDNQLLIQVFNPWLCQSKACVRLTIKVTLALLSNLHMKNTYIYTHTSNQATTVGPFQRANGVPAFIASSNNSSLQTSKFSPLNTLPQYSISYPKKII